MRYPSKEVIKAVAAKRSPEDHAFFLQNSLVFDHSLSLVPAYAERLDRLFDLLCPGPGIRKRAAKIQDLDILLANLLRQKGRKAIAISMRRDSYKPSKYTIAGYFTIELVKRLEPHGFIEIAKGFQSQKRSRVSRIWATPLLKGFFQSNEEPIQYEPIEIVELRDSNGEPANYQDTPETIRIRSILRAANILNRKVMVLVEIDGQTIRPSTDLHAVFNNSRFDHGGRLYTGYNGYQTLPKEDRKRIKIDGQPVVELDYSGLHPCISYALYAEQEYRDDPYIAISPNRALRPILKRILLALIHSGSERAAVSSVNYDLMAEPGWREALAEAGTTVKELVQLAKEAHQPIAHIFCKGIGFELMRVDSRIALDIVEHFAGKGIPILAVHDSFIVSAQYEDELARVMCEEYRLHSGGFSCSVERS